MDSHELGRSLGLQIREFWLSTDLTAEQMADLLRQIALALVEEDAKGERDERDH